MEFLKAKSEYNPQLKQMCMLCFDEDEEEVDLMFNGYISSDICYCAIEKDIVAAALYLVPCTMAAKEGLIKGHYLYAAATLPQFRGKGIMHALIKYALEEAKKQGDVFSALLPANGSLYDFYKEQGYNEFFAAQNFNIKYADIKEIEYDKKDVTNCSFDNIGQLRFNICIDKFGTVLWERKIMDFAVKGANLSKGGVLHCSKGYIIWFRDSKNTVFTMEFMCQSDDFEFMLNILKDNIPAESYNLRLPCWLAKGKKAERFGMVRFLCDHNENMLPYVQPYLGLTFD